MNSFVSAAADAGTPRVAGDEIVRLVDVHRRFGTTPALDGISLTVRKGEIVGLIGRSGAGKSTLIRCLNGLERPDRGEVFIEGRQITGLPERDLQPLRRRIGMIFQHFNLLANKTVVDNVALPLKIEGKASAERRKRALELLDIVGLADKANAYPSALSGGQKQRVGIARALAARPALLLSDEATSALDPETTRSILALLKDINQRLGLTILLITHEMEVVEGQVWSVFASPQSDISRSLLGGIRPQLPEAIAAALTDHGSERVLCVDIASAQAQAALFDLAAALPKSFRLIHGGIDHIQNQPVGRFFIGVPAVDPSLAAQVEQFLTARLARVEVLGYVSDHL
jgi:D-methionine transport system ATP-binding protein